MNEPVIALEGVQTRFGTHVVHQDLNLRVMAGEVAALVGGSGTGKTTLLRHIIGLTRPSAGRVRLFGADRGGLNRRDRVALQRRMGVCFQQGALFSALSVAENIAFALREWRGAHPDEVARLVALKLEMVELEPHQGRLMPAELSGGMIKRVALARALALEPELLLLDEPTAGLDPKRGVAFVQLIRSLQQRLGMTVVLVTHDVETLAGLASRVAVLGERRIISYASLAETMTLDHPFVRDFFFSAAGARVPVGGNPD